MTVRSDSGHRRSHGATFRSRASGAGLLGLVIWAAASLGACTRGTFHWPFSGGAPGGTRGYILISIDTLRADHLGCYGHDRDTSPFIDSLAARGALFENAYAQLPGTLPSHMSIFTGLYPAEHGVYPPRGVLSKQIKTLPEMLSAHGFRTAGHTEGGYVHGSYGFARGFAEFSDKSYKVECDVERTLARGLDFLGRVGDRERFFLFLHSYAVHDPYPDVRSPDVYHFPMKTYGKPFWPGDPPEGSLEPTGPHLKELNRLGAMPRGEVLDYYRAVYDAQIRYFDDLLRDFFVQLEELDLSDDLTVVLTSDHGEEFAEHGRLLHQQVYRETLHVPLIVIHPDLDAGRRIPELVESIDIAPTLLELAGIEPPSPVSGRSLLSLLAGSVVPGPREAYAEGMENAERTLLRQTDDGIHQLVWWPRSGPEPGRWMSRELSFDTRGEELVVEVESFHRPRRLEVLVDGEPVAGAGLELPKEEGGIWVSRSVAFDHPGEQVRFVLQSFHRPRLIEIFVGEEKLAEVPRVRARRQGPGKGEAGAKAGSRPGEVRIGIRPVVVEFTLPAGSRPALSLRTDGCDVPAELGPSTDRRCLAFQILEHEPIDRVREVSPQVVVTPEPWTLHLDLPHGGKKRVTFRVDSCDVPAELGLSDDPRCLSLRLSIPEVWDVELFDSVRDPQQASDLSALRPDLSEAMLRALNRYRFEPAARSESGELPPELEERLRALGYLP